MVFSGKQSPFFPIDFPWISHGSPLVNSPISGARATARPGGLDEAVAVEGHHLPVRGVVPGRSRGAFGMRAAFGMEFSWILDGCLMFDGLMDVEWMFDGFLRDFQGF